MQCVDAELYPVFVVLPKDKQIMFNELAQDWESQAGAVRGKGSRRELVWCGAGTS